MGERDQLEDVPTEQEAAAGGASTKTHAVAPPSQEKLTALPVDAAQSLAVPSKEDIENAVDAIRTVEDEERPKLIDVPDFLDIPAKPKVDLPGFAAQPSSDPTALDEEPVRSTGWPIAALAALFLVALALAVVAYLRS